MVPKGGFERVRAADEQEEKRDARERVRPEPRRQSRWPGRPRLRRANPPFPQDCKFERVRGADRSGSPARGSRNPRPLGSPASRSGRGEKRDAREPVSPEPRRKGRPTPERIALPGVPRNVRPEGQSHGGAAPLPDEVRSLGYPATNSLRGKVQAGKSTLQYQYNNCVSEIGVAYLKSQIVISNFPLPGRILFGSPIGKQLSLRSHFATLKKRPSQVFADGFRRLVTLADFPFRIAFMSTGAKTNFRLGDSSPR